MTHRSDSSVPPHLTAIHAQENKLTPVISVSRLNFPLFPSWFRMRFPTAQGGEGVELTEDSPLIKEPEAEINYCMGRARSGENI
mmetsp:Transcript_5579/g.7425  ORF Transcript_5579/g.7425 Transcript_5579/m.7425 type:complete len:84 (-) Transcript_5579:296-547(-)